MAGRNHEGRDFTTSVSTLARVSGVTAALAGALTVAATTPVFFLLPLALPIGLAQVVAGLRLLGGHTAWWWIAAALGCASLALSIGVTGELTAPVAIPAAIASIGSIAGSVLVYGRSQKGRLTD